MATIATPKPPTHVPSTSSNELEIGRRVTIYGYAKVEGFVVTNPMPDEVRMPGQRVEVVGPGVRVVEVRQQPPGSTVSFQAGAVMMLDRLADDELIRLSKHVGSEEWRQIAQQIGEEDEWEDVAGDIMRQARSVTKALVRAMNAAVTTDTKQLKTRRDARRRHLMTQSR